MIKLECTSKDVAGFTSPRVKVKIFGITIYDRWYNSNNQMWHNTKDKWIESYVSQGEILRWKKDSEILEEMKNEPS